MGQAIGGSLALAIAIAVSPIPVIAVVLMLTTAGGRVTGPAFLLGWLLGLGAIGAIVLALAGPAGQQAIAYLVFALIGTAGVAAPVAVYFALGERSRHPLATLKDWMGRNNAVIMSILCLIISAKLIGDAIGGLTG